MKATALSRIALTVFLASVTIGQAQREYACAEHLQSGALERSLSQGEPVVSQAENRTSQSPSTPKPGFATIRMSDVITMRHLESLLKLHKAASLACCSLGLACLNIFKGDAKQLSALARDDPRLHGYLINCIPIDQITFDREPPDARIPAVHWIETTVNDTYLRLREHLPSGLPAAVAKVLRHTDLQQAAVQDPVIVRYRYFTRRYLEGAKEQDGYEVEVELAHDLQPKTKPYVLRFAVLYPDFVVPKEPRGTVPSVWLRE